MHFTSFIVAGVFAVAASAQSATSTVASSSVVSSDPAESSTSVIEQCLDLCKYNIYSVFWPLGGFGIFQKRKIRREWRRLLSLNALDYDLTYCLRYIGDPSDTKCRANCIAVPSPDDDSVNATTSCVAACPQGNGTAEDNDAYAKCVDGCIGQYYYTTTGTPNLATSNAGNDDSSVTQVPTTIVTDGSTIITSVPVTASSPSNSANSANPTSDSGAAVYGPVGAGLGLFGLLAGFIAL
ncbi:hypothetical protein F5X97DRAFT_176553 [Nemania serpens]|nr:hypothetical protein F5X97DRAFT_176553 [Nemania serpens]